MIRDCLIVLYQIMCILLALFMVGKSCTDSMSVRHKVSIKKRSFCDSLTMIQLVLVLSAAVRCPLNDMSTTATLDPINM